MNVIETSLADVLILEPKLFGDERGFFMESWNAKTFNSAVGRNVDFVQDNHSKSGLGVLRGLHYQLQSPQAKLVRVTQGSVLDVVVRHRSAKVFQLNSTNKIIANFGFPKDWLMALWFSASPLIFFIKLRITIILRLSAVCFGMILP
jgi:hypothetical protein